MSSESWERSEVLDALGREMRWMSTYSVLFGQLVAARVGLPPTDLEALDILDLAGPIPVGRLAELTGLSSGAVTGLVDRLETAGCVRREPDPGDRRRVVVRRIPLPDPMLRILRSEFAEVGRAMNQVFARYGDGELALILGFATAANAVMAQRVAEVRTAAKAPRTAGDGPR